MKDFEAELAKLKRNNIKLSFQNDQLSSELSDLNHNFTLHIYAALESILQDKRAFYEPGTTTFKLKDGKFSKEVIIDPKELICVFTPEKGRKKTFVVQEDIHSEPGDSRKYNKAYELNSNDLNYEEIKKMIDPLSSRFVKIAKNTLVNVGYYRFDKRDELIFELKHEPQDKFSRFRVTLKGASELFELVKMHWHENYSLQKRITDYMNGETGFGRP